jgi:glycosyltransferase involved in cell wall biosynthesis
MTTSRWRPLVSVVIPCYNQADFLAEAIESALAQTHSPIEVLVVNDGSMDRTAEVAARFPSVRYIDRENGGAPRARNDGLRACSGELVLFLDADDRLLPDAVRRGVSALESHPEWALVTGHVRRIDGSGAVVDTPAQHHAGGDQFVALLRSNYIWTPGAVLYRRAVLESWGGVVTAPGAAGA